MRITFAFLVLICAWSASGEDARQQLEPFDYRGVTLDGGALRRQFDQVRNYYLRVPNDDLLRGFRLRAGLPAPGNALGGWYSADRFNAFGQILSGLARMHAATGDAACKEKVDTLVAEWARCIAPDGFFYFSDKPNALHYGYDKMVGGLVDAHHYCGNGMALDCLGRITGWAVKNLERTTTLALNGRMPATEWYTLSENLYRAWRETGDTKYREFAKLWEYTDYWNAYAEKRDIFALRPRYHAYSHVNTLSGAAQAYLASGDGHYLDALRNAYDYLQAHQVFATGGYGPGEGLEPDAALRRSLVDGHNHFETQCGSWAGFKMAKYLIALTGEARYGDWIERLTLNGVGASIAMSPQGETQYYSHYHLHGGFKHNNTGPWTCCTGTRPQAVADYDDLVYFKDERGIYVNLFTEATARLKVGGEAIVVRQRTRFPETSATLLTVETERPVRFAVKVRRPGWLSAEPRAKVNDQAVEAATDEKGWLVFERTWIRGDRLELTLPREFSFCRFPASAAEPFPCAIMYGPVVMALRSPSGNPSRWLDYQKAAANFVPVDGDRLEFRLAGHAEVRVKPYYAFGEYEPYFMYLDPGELWTRWPQERIKAAAPWRQGADFIFCNKPGTVYEIPFSGRAVRFHYRRFDDAGIARIRVDGRLAAEVDQYDPGRNKAESRIIENLPPGPHKLEIEIGQEKNPASRDHFVNIEFFAVRE